MKRKDFVKSSMIMGAGMGFSPSLACNSLAEKKLNQIGLGLFSIFSEMKGSYSIKFVLPALVPELSYDELEIKEGGTASNTFLSMVNGTFNGNTAKVRSQLLEYCKLDTYAMVKILERLKKVWVRYGVFGLYIDFTINLKKENHFCKPTPSVLIK